MGRARLITAAAFTGSLGWGTILPFQYAYVVDARHWGSTAGMLTGTLFCLGAVVAAPLAGRLADRYSAGRVAVAVSLLAAVATLGMGLAGSVDRRSSPGCWSSAPRSPQPRLRPRCSCSSPCPPPERRAVFAYQFTGDGARHGGRRLRRGPGRRPRHPERHVAGLRRGDPRFRRDGRLPRGRHAFGSLRRSSRSLR